MMTDTTQSHREPRRLLKGSAGDLQEAAVTATRRFEVAGQGLCGMTFRLCYITDLC